MERGKASLSYSGAEVGEPLDEWEPVASSPEDIISEFGAEEQSEDSMVGLSTGAAHDDISPPRVCQPSRAWPLSSSHR